MPKYYIRPFAQIGDKTAIPNDTQVSGSVSYEQGFGSDYIKPKIDPTSKMVPRNQFNDLMHDVTDNIQQYQQHGVPNFITTADNGGVAFPYSKWARVRYETSPGVFNIYESLVDANSTLPTDLTKWQAINSSGVVARVQLGANESILSGNFKIHFDTVVFDPYSMWTGSPNHIFTLKYPGYYSVTVNIFCEIPAAFSSENVVLQLFKNNSVAEQLDSDYVVGLGGAYNYTFNGSVLFHSTTVTDFIDARFFNTSPALFVAAAGSYFTIEYLGN